jgi:hypothetical protein
MPGPHISTALAIRARVLHHHVLHREGSSLTLGTETATKESGWGGAKVMGRQETHNTDLQQLSLSASVQAC